MSSFKEELKEIVGNSLLSFHGDFTERYFVIHYGPKQYAISVNKILELCDDEKELTIDLLLSSSHHLQNVCDVTFIGKIRLMDSIHNHLGSFNISQGLGKEPLFKPCFNDNLRMIDGGMPELLENAVNVGPSIGGNSTEILKSLIASNPLNINRGWGETTYRFKFGRLLYNFALGMTEDKVWDGRVDNGGVICYNGSTYRGFSFCDQTSIENFLIASTELFVDESHCCFKLLAA